MCTGSAYQQEPVWEPLGSPRRWGASSGRGQGTWGGAWTGMSPGALPSQRQGLRGLGWGAGPTPRGPPPPHGLPLPGSQILHGSLGPDEGAGHPHEAFRPAATMPRGSRGRPAPPPAPQPRCQDTTEKAVLLAWHPTVTCDGDEDTPRPHVPHRAHGTEEGEADAGPRGDVPAARGHPSPAPGGALREEPRPPASAGQHKGAFMRGDLTSSISEERAARSRPPSAPRPRPAGGAR